jgi:uncharacterized damage-inducible protein DinB
VAGVHPLLQPAAHALLQAAEECERAAATLSAAELWATPGGAASAGFHLRHIAGVIDRLLTYARGAALDERQLAELRREGDPGEPPATAAALLARVRNAVATAMSVLRSTTPEMLSEPRAVGRAALPSTVQGLLFHLAEHAQRHAGQLVTTVKVVRGTVAATKVGRD